MCWRRKTYGLNGEKAYVATPWPRVRPGSVATLHADAEDLQEAYAHFKTEATDVQATYQPQTVNTDGWSGTRNAWLALFPNIVLILCFLHGFPKSATLQTAQASFPDDLHARLGRLSRGLGYPVPDEDR